MIRPIILPKNLVPTPISVSEARLNFKTLREASVLICFVCLGAKLPNKLGQLYCTYTKIPVYFKRKAGACLSVDNVSIGS